MEWLTPTVTQHFQVRQIWGADADKCKWASGSPVNGIIQGAYSGVDSITSGSYTIGWFAYFTVQSRAYTKSDENPNDDNVYIRVQITTNHNKIWTSNEQPAGGFVDIGLIVWNPDRKPPATTTSSSLYLSNESASQSQLYDWAGINNNNVVCGVMADNETKRGKTLPNGTWGTHASGDDNPVSIRTFTLTFDDSAFTDDGGLKDECKMMPFVMASRWREQETMTGMAINRTLDIDLTVDPFIYIPWAIMKNGQWVSCNRRSDGLMVYKNGNFSKTVKNSVLARVVNGKLPSNANGFRMKNSKWQVSPITPDTED